MLYAILTLALILLIYAPQLWVRHTMKKFGDDVSDMPGTGGELADHLIQRFKLVGVVVEQTDEGRDHFDPSGPAVRLSPSNYNGRSLKAVAVAAHEVGHAIQYHRQERIFELRRKYIPIAMGFRKMGELLLLLIPVLVLIVKVPALMLVVVVISLILQLMGASAYLIMLPEEWDASFNKALPILIEGEYIQEQQVSAVRMVLKAAALTYFASALASIVHLGRWALLLRR
ncbi:zinc metallopeptidase [Motiliproteus sp. MSK22-1]|uniref:zinc metallopeptidase n=1 Tax=Motiliproteus sp. MSK22-1 TaxID=1897630 RepID=UPI00097571B2|nr:zinc metallopeptidase [Motiliproteus sp. MSK22-1]OMH34795.1 Zn-dependent protease [Motiliproteus sp. MSK22-1]